MTKSVADQVRDGDTCESCGLLVSDCAQHATGGCNDLRRAWSEDAALMLVIHRHMSPDMRRRLIDAVSLDNPTTACCLVDRFERLDRRMTEEAATRRGLVQEATGKAPVADAAGEAPAPDLGPPGPDELAFCVRLGLEDGWDDDTPQRKHLCWPFDTYEGALCGTPRLWGQGGGVSTKTRPTCTACIVMLSDLMHHDMPGVVVDAIGALARSSQSGSNKRAAVRGLIGALTPQLADLLRNSPALRELVIALEADAARHAVNAESYTRKRARAVEPTV